MSAAPQSLPAPLYVGSANQWECDDGGHLNIRFHFERLSIGLMHFAQALEMARAFSPDANATLLPLDIHARFHKEARPPAPLFMHGAVVAIGSDHASLCCDMRHEDGALATTFVAKVAHAEARTLKRFSWSARTQAAAANLTRDLPDYAAPRSIDLTRAPAAEASIARAKELGAARVGMTAVLPEHCDAFGRLRLDQMIGRVSDSAPNLQSGWRKAAATMGIQAAGAVVEARVAIRKMPRAGDLIDIHSGVAETQGKVRRLVHWLCDPVSGDAWATMEVIALVFDVATRKTIAPNAEAQAMIDQLAAPGMTI